MDAFIQNLANSKPIIFEVMSVLLMLRVVNKPLFAFLHSQLISLGFVKADEQVTKIELSLPYRSLLWILDYVASIKAIPQGVNVVPKGTLPEGSPMVGKNKVEISAPIALPSATSAPASVTTSALP
jgi:hypothetical protein